MRNKAVILLVMLMLAGGAFLYADTSEKELEKNWSAAVDAYNLAPSSKDTADKIDAFIARWKDTNKYEAGRAEYLKALQLFRDKKYGTAFNVFKDLMDQFSSTTFCDSSMYMMGECLYNQAKYEDAIEMWNSYRFKYTESMFAMEAVYGISLSWLQLKEYKKADNDLSKFLTTSSWYANDDKIKLIGGLIDYYLARYEDAVDKLKRLKSDVAYYYLGHSYMKLGKYPEAASAFKSIVEDYKGSKYTESALYNEAEAFYKGLNFDQSSNTYKAFLDKFPASALAPYAKLKRGSSLYNSQKQDLAVADWAKGASGEGDKRVRAYAQYLVAETYRSQKKYKEALAAYNKVISDFPDVYEVVSSSQVKSGWCYLVLGDSAKAEEILTQFTQKFVTHEDLPLGFYLLGTSAYNKKNYPDALQAYKYLLDKFNYSDLTEAALLMTELCYYNQQQDSMLVSDASSMLENLEDKFPRPAQTKIRARSYYYLGLSYYKMGMYGPASQAFKRIVDYYYDTDIVTEARANLAWCYYEIENYKGARTMAKDVVSNPNISKDVKMACEILIAHSYFSEKAYDKAVAAYAEFAYNNKKSPNTELVAESLFQAGKAYEVQEFYADAIKQWQALVDNYPKSKRAPEAMFKIADILFKAQQFDKALMGFEEIIRRWPKDVVAEDAMLSIAEVYYNSDQEAKAVKAYEDFIKKYPDSKKVTSVEEGMQRADFKKADKKNDPELLLAFADKYPTSTLVVNALYRAAEIYYQGNKPDKAVPAFNKVIEQFPNDTLAVNAQYYLGACFEAEKKMDDAVNAYKAFLKNYPKHDLAPDVMSRLAAAAYTAKNYADASFYFERIIEKYVGTEGAQNAMYNVALIYNEMGKPDESISAYRRFLKEYPKDTKAKDLPMLIAGMYLEQKRYKEAVAEYNAIAADNGTPDASKLEAIYRAGDIYSTNEEQDNAITMFTRLLDMKPKDSVFRVTGLVSLATLLEEKKKWVDAVNVYQQIASSGGQKDYVDGAVGRIAEIKRVYADQFAGSSVVAPKAEATAPETSKKEEKKKKK
jgi:TolA-binding protein